jgi:hypothetical protein
VRTFNLIAFHGESLEQREKKKKETKRNETNGQACLKALQFLPTLCPTPSSGDIADDSESEMTTDSSIKNATKKQKTLSVTFLPKISNKLPKQLVVPLMSMEESRFSQRDDVSLDLGPGKNQNKREKK